MKSAIRCVAVVHLVLATVEAGTAATSGDERLRQLFDEAGVAGTLVIADAGGDPVAVHNRERAARQFSPASTFKVPNTLIALQAGIVAGPESTFAWDGTDRGRDVWNRDQTLESAFRVSCVWCYQVVAREIGRGAYAEALQSFGYGNGQIGEVVDEFWLDGSLRISAIEQVGFLARLLNGGLDVSDEHRNILHSIMARERVSGARFFGKTGWTGARLKTGWYVGYVEASRDRYLFALNIEMSQAEDAPLREQLVRDGFSALGLLPGSKPASAND